ncbi:prepilin-type N-terminal cleavage/methylation domain-containing protein [Candidatus Saccharibacteria bacterium]|nr:prepilin-type N-terminal cleavage/methylation domain-containing protein [Candidatus Saccharibacteria bacterium]
MSTRDASQGFTAVELLVAIAVGVLLLSASYQLYSIALSSSGDAQRRTIASMTAYDLLRARQAAIGKPCSTSTVNPTVPTNINLPGASASVVATCPYDIYSGATLIRRSNVTLLTSTVSYDNNSKQVTRAIAVEPQD